jgi:hypothetical protein
VPLLCDVQQGGVAAAIHLVEVSTPSDGALHACRRALWVGGEQGIRGSSSAWCGGGDGMVTWFA